MKKILFLSLCLISWNAFSQINGEPKKIIDSISKIINKNITFVSWYVENDTVKITQFTTYDRVSKTYTHFYIEDIKKYYPILLTTNFQLPFSSTYRSNIDNINRVHSIDFRYRPNLKGGSIRNFSC